jgi:hypothetical protein
MQNKTQVRVDTLSNLIVGINRALNLYDGELEIEVKDNQLQINDKLTGEYCTVRLGDNVKVKGE